MTDTGAMLELEGATEGAPDTSSGTEVVGSPAGWSGISALGPAVSSS